MKPLRHLVFSVILLAASALGTRGDSLVIPNGYENTVGEGGQLPFAGEGVRNQEIYGADHFIAAMPSGGIIEEIALRANESDRRTVDGSVPQLEVRMSTTPSLQPVVTLEFSKNIGSDYRTVFSGPVPYSLRGSATGPNPFLVRIPLEESFYYDPRQGGLLIEFLVGGFATTGLPVDGTFSPNAIAIEGNSANSEGQFLSPLAMEIIYTPVPEPTVWLLVGAASCIVLVWRRALS